MAVGDLLLAFVFGYVLSAGIEYERQDGIKVKKRKEQLDRYLEDHKMRTFDMVMKVELGKM